jgi:hypothetical protein
MNAKQKKNTVIGLLIAAILFLGSKKKKVGSVEVGKGGFGDFGTDGDFAPFGQPVKTPDFVGSFATAGGGFNTTMDGVMNEKKLDGDCGCVVS